ncbi:MAG: hypothetical protein ACPGVB_14765 [Chitinophagales bacterium]
MSKNPKFKFQWKQIEGKRVNHKLLPDLKEMTTNHCSFCDGSPMGAMIKETIEHFRPKSKYPLLAYQWENLFLACHFCQEKGDTFDEKLLKPDDVAYEFNRYFIFNFRTYEIEVRQDSGISEEDKERAKITLEIYKLNYTDRSKARQRTFKQYYNTLEANRDVDDFSYRYMFL